MVQFLNLTFSLKTKALIMPSSKFRTLWRMKKVKNAAWVFQSSKAEALWFKKREIAGGTARETVVETVQMHLSVK